MRRRAMSPAPLMTPGRDSPPANARVGPEPSVIQVAKPYIFEKTIQVCTTANGVNEVKEDSFRLQGVAWIDNVRRALQLYDRGHHCCHV